MIKYLLLVFLVFFTFLYSQSTVTIGPGSSVSVGVNSSLAASSRDGTMSGTGSFNSRAIVVDPVATAATSVTQTTFISNWNLSAGANGYKLDVSTDVNFGSFITGYQNLDVGNVNTYSVSGLSTGTTYYYRLRAYDVDGITGYSNKILVITAPPASVASAATLIIESSFTANWGASAGATKYYLDVATTNTFNAGTFLAGYEDKDVGNTTTFNISGLTANTNYYYRVRTASASGGISNNSNTITVLTASLPPVSTAATSIAQTSFSANWNASVGANKYYLDVSTSNTFASYLAGFNAKDVGNVTTYSVSGLTAGTTYYYRIRSSNGDGVSTYSGTINVLTLPSNPTAIAASDIFQTNFKANWNTTATALKYYIDVSDDPAFGSFITDWNNKDVGNVTSYVINTNLSGGITYYYRVRAENASGVSGNSNIINIVTVPAEPSTIAATAFLQTGFDAKWNAASGVTGYRLDVSLSNTFSNFVTGYNNLNVANVTTYSVTGLSAGTTYYYRVRGYNANGTSGNSNITNIITIPADPVAIAASSVSTTSFGANWNPVAGVTKYYIDVASDNLFANKVTGWDNYDAGNNTSALINVNLVAGTNYYYRVRSENSSGTSSNSGTITVLTAPLAAVAAAATDLAELSFSANWGAAAGSEGYYLDVSTNTNFDGGTFVTGFENKDVGAVTTLAVNTNLFAGTTYYYRIRSYNSGGTSSNSNKITVLTLPAAPVPSAASSVTGTTFSSNWNSSASATGYKLDVSTDPAFGSFIGVYNNLDVNNVSTYSVTGLTANTTYYYRVKAYNSSGTGENSSNITLLTSPGKPTIQTATSASNNGFTANWLAAAGAAGYYLDVSVSNTFNSFVSGYNSLNVGNVTSYSVTGLTAATTYYYRVRAYSGSSPGVDSDTESILTLSPAPVASAASAINTTSFTANWGASTNATGYRLDVSLDPAFGVNLGSYDNLDVLNVTTKNVTGLTAGNTYYYRIRAYNGSGTNGNSNVISVSVVPPVVSEQAATNISTNGFSANWLAANGATGYKLDVSAVANFASFVAGYNDLDVGNVLTYAITGLAENTPYYYRIRAYNTGGTGTGSGTITLTTAGTAPRIPSVNPASNVLATSFAANWVASPNATKYFLDVSTVSNFASYVTDWQNVDVGNVVTKTVNTNLTAGTQYYYRVRAFNADGTSGNSSVVSVITIPPAPVEADKTNLTNNSFDANWNSSTGASGYRLDVSTDAGFAGGSFVTGFNNLDVGNVLTYSVTGLTGGTAYYYRIRAYNTGGTSGNSGTTTFSTSADPAGTVVATSATAVSETSFNSNWTAYGTATGYKLDVSTSSGFGAGTFVTGYEDLDVGNVTTLSVNSNIVGGTNYYYRIKAYDGTGVIANSGTVSVLTIPPAPVENAASTFNETSFDANWTASTGANGYYLDVATDAGFTSFVTGFNNKYVNNVTSYTVTGLSAGTTYYYQIRSKNSSGISGNSGTITTKTIPNEPVVTSASVVQSVNFTANWNSSTGASGYRLDVATDAGFGIGTFVTGYNNLDVGNVTTYAVNTNITSGTKYFYRIRAYNSSGTSINSGIIELTTAPAAPVANNASAIENTYFTANWAASTGATKYFIDVSTTNTFNAGTFVSGFENLDAGNSTSILVNGLNQGITYYYRIRSFNSNGTSTDSGTKSALTKPAIPVVNPVTVKNAASFTASWNSTTGADKYYLDVSTVSNFASFVNNWQNVDVGNVTSKSVNTDLSAGTTYYFRVRASNATGLSGNSDYVITETTPSAPVATAATTTLETSLVANWNSVAGATGYFLSVSTVSNFASFVAGYNNLDVGNITSYTITGLSGGTTYYYRVNAYKGSNSGPESNTITALVKPSASTATSASTIAETTFNANWNSVTGVSGYYLDVAVNSGFTSFVAGFNNKDVSNVTTYTITGLSANTQYYYRIRAYNASGTGNNSNTINALTVPSAPVATAATTVSNIGMTANWNTVAGASKYYLDISTTNTFNAGTYLLGYADKDVSAVTHYDVTGLNGSTNYYYRVRAYNSSGQGISSNVITVTTSADPSPAPVATAATALAETSISANWNVAATATGYRLDVSTNIAFNNYVAGYQDLDVGNVTTYSVAGLSSATTYYYRLRSYNGTGTSSNSNVITALTLPGQPSVQDASSVESSGFASNWLTVNGASGYKLDVSTSNTFASFVPGYQDLDVGNVITKSVVGLNSGVTYYYRIRAYNASGNGGYSGNSSVLTKPASPVPSAATTVTQTGFDANWAAATGTTKYYLDVATDNTFTNFVSGYNNKDVANVTTFTISSLSANTTYYYRVRGNNASGNSSNSATITVLGIPTGKAATLVNESGFYANWEAVTGVNGYKLDVATDAGFTSFVAGYNNLDVNNVLTYQVTGLNANTNYYYRIRSYDAGGSGNSSSNTNVFTAPPIPVSTAATAKTNVSFTANWNSSVGATGYYLDVAADNAFTDYLSGFQNKDVGNVTTYQVTGLNIGTTYFYRVRSYNATSYSSNSSVISVLAAPATSTATNLAQTTFDANWGTVVGATKYYLDVATDINFTGGTYVAGYQDKDVGLITTFTVSGLIKNTNYYYRLRAFDGSVLSGNSNTQAVTTLPSAPLATQATGITQTSFSANWNVMAGGGTYTYRLDVATDAAFTNILSGFNDLNVGAGTTYLVNGVSSGINYYYRLRATNSYGTSDNSNTINVITAPGNPEALSAGSYTKNSFNARWSLVDGADGYYIDVAMDPGFTEFLSGYNNRGVTGSNSSQVTGTDYLKTYYFRVRAYNSAGISGNSNIIAVPGAPTLNQVSAITQNGFTASWNSVPGATSYKIEISANKSFSPSLSAWQGTDVGNVTTYKILSGLNPGEKFYYRIKASCDGETGAGSDADSVLTIPANPLASNATSVTQTNFTANWNLVTNASGYKLDIAEDENFTKYLSGYQNTEVGNVQTLQVNLSLISGTKYYYRVRSYNESGTSGNSNTITVETVPGNPVALKAVSIAQKSFDANWIDIKNASGYYIDVANDSTFINFVEGYNNKILSKTVIHNVNLLSQGSIYYFRLRAFNTSGVSGNSNFIKVLTISADPAKKEITAVTKNGAKLKWDLVQGASGYKIDIASDKTFNISGLMYNNTDMNNLGEFEIKNLSSGTKYFYRIRSYNSSGMSGNSLVDSLTTVSAAPVALPSTEITQTGFKANWQLIKGATGYKADISTNVNFSEFVPGYQNIDVGNTGSLIINQGLAAGTKYFYRVRSYNLYGISENSNIIETTTVPENPVAFAASSISQFGFTVNWGSVKNSQGYKLDISTNPDFTSFINNYQNKDISNITSHSVTEKLQKGTNYYYRLRSYNESGQSGYSNVIMAITLPNVAPVLVDIETDEPVYSIKDIELQITQNIKINDVDDEFVYGAEISVSGMFNSNDDVISFNNPGIETISWDKNTCKLKASGKAAKSIYENFLRSVKYKNISGSSTDKTLSFTFVVRDESITSNSVKRNIKIYSVINAPSDLTYKIDEDDCVLLSWKDNSDNEESFLIDRSGNNSQTIFSVSANQTTFKDTTAEEGQIYSYSVKSFSKKIGSSGFVSLNNVKVPLRQPLDFTYKIDEKEYVLLSWKDNSDKEESYVIERNGNNYRTLFSVNANQTTFRDTTAEEGQIYTYAIKSFSSKIESSGFVSLGKTVVIALRRPVELTAVAKPQGIVELNWKCSTKRGEGYIIERSDSVNGEFKEIGKTMSGMYFIDNKIINQKKYYYRIKTYLGSLCSGYSNTTEIIGYVVGINEDPDGIPNDFVLMQNYPNPFNPVTRIKFGLPEAANVKVVIYSLLGEEVAVLIDSFKPAGYHVIEFNGSNLSSGIYFCRMITDHYVSIKKMLLLK